MNGRTGLVFGGTSGIGRALSLRLAREGARLLLAYSPMADGSRAAVDEVLAEGGDGLIAFEADLTNPDQVRAAFDEAERAFGRLDFAVNTAAVMSYGAVIDVTEENYDRVFEVNTKGTFFFLQCAARAVADGGRVIAFSSGAARIGHPGGAVYGGSKAAVEQFVRNLAWELAPRNITVNVISPGITDTPMLIDEFRERGAAMSPFGRLGMPEDVADVAAMLLGDDARWLTGQTIFAGGGVYMG